jgi:fatty-acyl-CoA synthase
MPAADKSERVPNRARSTIKRMNIAEWITGWASRAPNRTAIYFQGGEISYAEFERRILNTAAALKSLGIKKTDRVAILEYNTPDYLALIFACAHLGATAVPLNWRLTGREHLVQINDCLPDILFAGAEFIDHAQELRGACHISHWVSYGTAPEGWLSFDALLDAANGTSTPVQGDMDSALLLVYTSGTTGKPKGAVLTQNAVYYNALNSVSIHGLTDKDRILTDLPMFHVGGLNIQTLPAFYAGASVILHPRFNAAKTLLDIETLRPSINLMVPATMQALINHPAWNKTDLSSLRLAMTGSSIIPLPLLQAFLDRGIPTVQVYGSTETCPIAISLAQEYAQAKIGSCGKAVLQCEAKVVMSDGSEAPAGERGEIYIRGQNLFSGYWNDEDSTAATMSGDWFKTGDIGHNDEDGFYYIDERSRDVIISGGENIYPAEIENIITGLPGVHECAVIGKPDEHWGEVPVVFIVADDGENIDIDWLVSALEGQLAHFKIPREVTLIDELPRNVMGKILKYKLREDYLEKDN